MATLLLSHLLVATTVPNSRGKLSDWTRFAQGVLPGPLSYVQAARVPRGFF